MGLSLSILCCLAATVNGKSKHKPPKELTNDQFKTWKKYSDSLEWTGKCASEEWKRELENTADYTLMARLCWQMTEDGPWTCGGKVNMAAGGKHVFDFQNVEDKDEIIRARVIARGKDEKGKYHKFVGQKWKVKEEKKKEKKDKKETEEKRRRRMRRR